jgi:hypothetical protein
VQHRLAQLDAAMAQVDGDTTGADNAITNGG